MTCGVRTSEFYLTILATLAGLAVYFGGNYAGFEVSAALIGAITAPVIVYTGGRSYVKKTNK